MHDNSEQKEKAVLVSVDVGNFDAYSSLLELSELVKSADATPFFTMTQKRDKPDFATCIGSGRILEIKEFCENNDIDLLIFDCELTPTQIRNIEKAVAVRVVDRTMLILDIFALRAKSKEGKLQVELAQLQYMLPRLTGKGVVLSRLGGGIGTRGPGETQLETDKRHIRRRMKFLKERINQIENHRESLRQRRKKDGFVTVAIVGYTNAGKSTLMNTLTKAGVLVEDKLFATLDPSSKALTLENGVRVMVIDTVGLVRRLPHHLIKAFRSTLEEAALADIILNVCDASNEEATLHLDVTRDLLKSLGCINQPIINVMNKCDLIKSINDLGKGGDTVRISAKKGLGINELLKEIEINLPIKMIEKKFLFDFKNTGKAKLLRENGTVKKEEYTESGLLVEAVASEKITNMLSDFVI